MVMAKKVKRIKKTDWQVSVKLRNPQYDTLLRSFENIVL